MKFAMNHFNFNVNNLEESIQFYQDALGLKIVRKVEKPDFTLVYLGEEATGFQLELTYLHKRKEAYDLGEAEYHLALETNSFDEAYQKHKEMGIVCFENPAMGIYFIEDPTGYWIEIIPSKK